MDPRIIEVGIVLGSLGAWFALYGLLLLVTRPRRVQATAATPDLGTEPPAVVGLVCDGWAFTEDAAEATLLDLGARKQFEFRQPADDPFHTTIHMRQSTAPANLASYERRVLDRVAGLAVDGVVPLTALTFRDKKRSQEWWKRLRAEVVADARARGLSRRRFSAAIVSTLVGAALLATVGVVFAVVHYGLRHPAANGDDDPIGFVVPAAIFTFFGLSAFAARYVGERDTPAGREVAARWLGVKAWLRAHESFADLPPASVAVWDRYLGYGAALGVTRVASAVIDLGMGNRRRVWSSYGGTWHRVRIRYPMRSVRYGAMARTLATRGVVALGLGYVLVRWWREGVDWVSASELFAGNSLLRWAAPIREGGFLLGVGLLVLGAYHLVRVLVDLFTPVTVTGQVLWVQLCRSTSGGEDRPPVPWLYHLAVDDGRGDRTTAWGLPAPLSGRCDPGDTVTLTARRWTRRVLTVKVDEPGSRGYRAGGGEDDRAADSLHAQVSGTGVSLKAPAVEATGLLTASEVTQALELPVTLVDLRTMGGMGMVHFTTNDRKRTVLMLQVVAGTMGDLAWRTNSRGTQVPGIADGAWVNGNRAVVRVGETTIVFTLLGKGKGRTAQYTSLMAQAAARARATGPGSTPATGPGSA